MDPKVIVILFSTDKWCVEYYLATEGSSVRIGKDKDGEHECSVKFGLAMYDVG